MNSPSCCSPFAYLVVSQLAITAGLPNLPRPGRIGEARASAAVWFLTQGGRCDTKHNVCCGGKLVGPFL